VILVDTTVLVYAVGTDHPLRAPCRRILQAQRAGSVSLTTTVEIIQEFVHVCARRRSREDAAAMGRLMLDAFDIVTPTAEDLRRGLEVFEDHPGLGAFDAILAGIALESQCEALISADGAFGSVDGLPWIHPSEVAA
jgi:predicted nucleic acid-binding protein